VRNRLSTIICTMGGARTMKYFITIIGYSMYYNPPFRHSSRVINTTPYKWLQEEQEKYDKDEYKTDISVGGISCSPYSVHIVYAEPIAPPLQKEL